MTSEKGLLREYYCDTVPLCLICSIGFLLLSLIVYMPENNNHTIFYVVKDWRIRICWSIMLLIGFGWISEQIKMPLCIKRDMSKLQTNTLLLRAQPSYSIEHFHCKKDKAYIRIVTCPPKRIHLPSIWRDYFCAFYLDTRICDGKQFDQIVEKIKHGKIIRITFYRHSRIIKSIGQSENRPLIEPIEAEGQK